MSDPLSANERAFLTAIVERPDEDAPRLMYSDWLSEHGDLRGQFIRDHIRITSVPGFEDTDEFQRLKERENGILAIWAEKFRDVCPDGMMLNSFFNRGLPAYFTCSLGLFVERLSDLLPIRYLVYRGGTGPPFADFLEPVLRANLKHTLHCLDFSNITMSYQEGEWLAFFAPRLAEFKALRQLRIRGGHHCMQLERVLNAALPKVRVETEILTAIDETNPLTLESRTFHTFIRLPPELLRDNRAQPEQRQALGIAGADIETGQRLVRRANGRLVPAEPGSNEPIAGIALRPAKFHQSVHFTLT